LGIVSEMRDRGKGLGKRPPDREEHREIGGGEHPTSPATACPRLSLPGLSVQKLLLNQRPLSNVPFQIRTRIHHPQSNGTVERYHRTFREEGWAGHQPADYPAAKVLIARWVERYNTVRLHSALGYLPPLTYYRGDPAACFSERCQKLQTARARRQDAWDAYHTAARSAA